MYQPRAFLCIKCGFVLGESYREPESRITQLRIYRHPRDKWDRPIVNVTILYAATQVNDCKVFCEHCHAETSWFANQTAIQEMLERKSARQAVTA